MSSDAIADGTDNLVGVSQSHVQDLSAIEKILRCEICRDLMALPFILNCGHTFCYLCAFEWLKSQRSCPRCRARVCRKPILDYGLKEIFEIIVRGQNSRNTTSSTHHNSEHHREQAVLLVSHGQDLFPGLFRSTATSTVGGMMEDLEDHVLRCSRCHWEVEGLECLHCGHIFSDCSLNSDESANGWGHDSLGSAVDSQDSRDESLNDYDSLDSFIVPDGEGSEADDASASSSSASNSARSVSVQSRNAPGRRNKTRIVISSDDDENLQTIVAPDSRPLRGNINESMNVANSGIIQISDESDGEDAQWHRQQSQRSGHTDETSQTSDLMDEFTEEFYGFE